MKLHTTTLTRHNTSIDKITIGEYRNADETVYGKMELDVSCISGFMEKTTRFLEEGNHDIIMDLNHVVYIDSCGLWALFELYKRANFEHKKIAFINLTKDVKRVLDVTKMSSKLLIFDSEEDAINALTTSAHTTP